MPPRRRVGLNAAHLPPSRLPLGSPHLAPHRSPPASRTNSRASNHSVPSTWDTDSETAAHSAAAPSVSLSQTDEQPSSMSSANEIAIIAAAKLARQGERIQKSDPTVAAPLPAERPRAAKGKKTVWQPFDFTADSPAATQASVTTATGTEIRINTFRAPETRDSSLSRSMSSLSQRTDMERQSSVDSGFQLYTGRKNKVKVPEQLNAYEDKPEQKQTTVEAASDDREVYEVFGNALPNIDVLNESPGSMDGQLRFVQHRNGDIAAHQWSNDRFLWENIGHYSNIRKKIEGQLAADRLKGETAYQTLQQNSLAYFRTVAKQREVAALGRPFGAKEIGALLPDSRPAPSVPTLLKKPASMCDSASALDHVNRHSVDDQSSSDADPRDHIGAPPPHQAFTNDGYPAYNNQVNYGGYPAYGAVYGQHQGYPYAHPFYPPAGPRAERYTNNFFQGPPPALHDPFYSQQQSYRNIYGGIPAAFGGQPAKTPGYGAPGGYGGHDDLNYDYDFPPADARGSHARPTEPRTMGDPGMTLRPVNRAASRYSTEDQDTSAEGTNNRPARYGASQFGRVSVESSLQPQSAASLNARSSMRHQLFKLSDQAEKRNLSQTDLRAALPDPFSPEPTPNVEQVAQEAGPELKRTVANPSGLPPSVANAMRSSQSKWSSDGPSSASRASVDGRADTAKSSSSPVNYWDRSGATPFASSASKRKEDVTPPKAMGETLDDLLGYFEAKAKAEDEDAKANGTKTWDQKLAEWWKNGNTFQRHEDFFHAVKAADTSYKTSSTPDTLPPIGTPAKKSAEDGRPVVDKHDAHTRLLIPVLENLASYVQGPVEKRRDYFSQWTQPPDWAIDRNDNSSFYDTEPWEPPARVGRDPRYRPMPAETPERYSAHRSEPGRFGVENVRFGAFNSPTVTIGSGLAVGAGLERRFAFGRM